MKVIIVAGARPNFMKVAPLIRAIERHNKAVSSDCEKIRYKLVHTGQHYDLRMSEVFFRDLELPRPDVNLEVGSASHAAQTANIMIKFEQVCLDEMPDWVIVVGDVNSTMACTIVAAKLGIKVGHVEAGLRSFDRSMPEEINRLVTDVLADLLFTPSEDADENLLREGVSLGKIRRVGNIMIDTLLTNLDKARQRKTYEEFGLKKKHYALITLHRPQNTDTWESLSEIMKALESLSRKITCLFPVHPRTRNKLERHYKSDLSVKDQIKLIEPLGYHDFICLVDSSLFVVTDSGGLQEETTFLNIPCLTLRPSTERPITVTQGTNKLTSIDSLGKDAQLILQGNSQKSSVPILWDGLTGKRIIDILVG